MKKYLKIIFILLIFLSLKVSASTKIDIRTREDLKVRDWVNKDPYNIENILNTYKVDETEKVYDFADILKEEEENKLFVSISNFIDKTGYDLAVLTIKHNNKYSTKDYADDFYDYNYFGYDENNSGLLLVVDMDKREVYISTTGYGIKMYDDKRIDKIIDAGYISLKNGKYYDTFDLMINKTLEYYNEGFPESNKNLVIEGHDVRIVIPPKTFKEKLKIGSIIGSLSSFIITLIFYFKSKLSIRVKSLYNYLDDAKNYREEERFLTSSLTRTKIDYDQHSSGGFHGGGGSSFHSSSSGGFHGGGGRSF